MSITSKSFTRLFIRFGALPLLFIAGVQLFVLSEQTEYYFAWTIGLPLTAAFLGAGYWAAMGVTFMNWWEDVNVGARTTGLTTIAATTILGIATFLHLDKFHLNSPALLTRFVTWVWILVYVVTPFVFLWRWLAHGRGKDASIGAKPFPSWIRTTYITQSALALITGLALFFAPKLMASYWAWELTPLTARAISAWIIAYGFACLEINRENNTVNTMPARISLLMFSILQLIAIARYFSSFDLSKPAAWIYLLVMITGLIVNLPNLYTRKK